MLSNDTFVWQLPMPEGIPAGQYQDTQSPSPVCYTNANLFSVDVDFLSFHPLSLLSPKHTHDPGPESLRGNNSVRFRSESRDRRQFQGHQGRRVRGRVEERWRRQRVRWNDISSGPCKRVASELSAGSSECVSW